MQGAREYLGNDEGKKRLRDASSCVTTWLYLIILHWTLLKVMAQFYLVAFIRKFLILFFDFYLSLIELVHLNVKSLELRLWRWALVFGVWSNFCQETEKFRWSINVNDIFHFWTNIGPNTKKHFPRLYILKQTFLWRWSY